MLTLATAMSAISFVSCGKDDNGPQDHPLTDKGSFIANGGVFNGKVTIKNSIIEFQKNVDASVKFSPGTDNGLQMLVNNPADFTPITCTNFMESADSSRIWFTMSSQNYTFTGNEVPPYYTESFGNIGPITRVVIKSYTFSNVLFDVQTQTLSFIVTASADIFTKDNLTGTESINPSFSPTVVYTFENLKK